MLFDKSALISDGDTVSFKLVNGDEIVSHVKTIQSSSYVLERPCLVVPGQKGIGLIQAMFSVDPDSTVTIDKQHVMMMAPTLDAMKSHYIQVTTGIQPVSKGSIIT
jgi:hypothetical protein